MSENIQRQPVTELSERVLAAAKLAWEVHGETVSVRTVPINGHGVMPSIVAENARRLEFVIEADDADAWQALTEVSVDSWELRALVPLTLLGVAHQKLRPFGYELQGWWTQAESVHFGSVEIA
jgi:hypothetical protein